MKSIFRKYIVSIISLFIVLGMIISSTSIVFASDNDLQIEDINNIQKVHHYS